MEEQRFPTEEELEELLANHWNYLMANRYVLATPDDGC